MVRAILDGRKTQTRRVIKNQPAGDWPDDPIFVQYGDNKFKWKSVNYGESSWFDCPFGKVGDRLYVRETWGVVSHCFDDDGLMTDWIPDRPAKAIHELPYGRGYYNGHAIYAADGDFTWGDDDGGGDGRSCWNPSIHMPKAASRITLEITDIRVERLHAITLGDICKEIGCGLYDFRPATHGFSVWEDTWKSIHGQDSWQSNPWVWVVEFKRVEAA
ncbi:hypothetical protein [Rosenbergiella nectarea]|uniref:hypothetical protein n=1 Tax=Rosenbergiella nectarea TaxID=988801 RepID=UPI0023DFA237|nr:hypothetical protein [Rosenbergiella nectarea]